MGTKPTIKDYFKDKIQSITNDENSRRKKDRKAPLQTRQVLDVLNKAITENEKAIRFKHETDRILLLIIKKLIKLEKESEVQLDTVKSTLNKTTTITQKILGKLSFDKQDDDSEITIEKTITDKRKRKDSSVLHKLAFDRRLPELFQYFPEKEIPFSKIKIELNSYNTKKELFFDAFFELEKVIIEKFKTEVITKRKSNKNKNDNDNIRHEPYLVVLKEHNLISEEEFKFLKVIRNTYSHNKFPPQKIISIFVEIKSESPISDQIFRIYNDKIKHLIKKIKDL